MARMRRLGEIILEAGLVNESQLDAALSHHQTSGVPLGAALVKLGFIAEQDLLQALSAKFEVPMVNLQGRRIAPEVLDLVPQEIAEKYSCIPLFTKQQGGQEVLYLGMVDPSDLSALDDVTFRTGRKIRPSLVGHSQFEDAVARHYQPISRPPLGDAPTELELGTPVEDGDTAPMLSRYVPEAVASPPPSSAVPQAAAEAAAAVSDSPVDDPSSVKERPQVGTRAILRAVTDLLMEKGVFTREELMKRVRSVEERKPPS